MHWSLCRHETSNQASFLRDRRSCISRLRKELEKHTHALPSTIPAEVMEELKALGEMRRRRIESTRNMTNSFEPTLDDWQPKAFYTPKSQAARGNSLEFVKFLSSSELHKSSTCHTTPESDLKSPPIRRILPTLTQQLIPTSQISFTTNST